MFSSSIAQALSVKPLESIERLYLDCKLSIVTGLPQNVIQYATACRCLGSTARGPQIQNYVNHFIIESDGGLGHPHFEKPPNVNLNRPSAPCGTGLAGLVQLDGQQKLLDDHLLDLYIYYVWNLSGKVYWDDA